MLSACVRLCALSWSLYCQQATNAWWECAIFPSERRIVHSQHSVASPPCCITRLWTEVSVSASVHRVYIVWWELRAVVRTLRSVMRDNGWMFHRAQVCYVWVSGKTRNLMEHNILLFSWNGRLLNPSISDLLRTLWYYRVAGLEIFPTEGERSSCVDCRGSQS